ncbi:hypothetical protein HNP70_000906 [Borreliella kurtenbachii]
MHLFNKYNTFIGAIISMNKCIDDLRLLKFNIF